jgi:hypothetical protein
VPPGPEVRYGVHFLTSGPGVTPSLSPLAPTLDVTSMTLIDLYSIHAHAAREGMPTLHPSRWLYSGRQLGGVFDIFSKAEQTVVVGDRTATHFRHLETIGLGSKIRHTYGHYLASEAIAKRYKDNIPKLAENEGAVRDMLSIDLPQCELEAHTPVGKIDILTPEAVIEVKRLSKWKQALGQVLAYATYHPKREPVVHLFGPRICRTNLDEIRRTCRRLGVIVRYAELQIVARP